ncbi:MAG: hypothetical protein JW737_08645 [Acidobacteria bacterium]|nr:hypothetical protein [Acidobacteriota bacterium]
MLAVKVLRKAVDSLFSGIIFLTLGIIVLLNNLNHSIDAGLIIGKYWPALLIFLGIKYVLFSVIGTTKGLENADPETEEETLQLLHGRYPAANLIWGLGFIFAGLLLFFELRSDEHDFWNLLLTFWPVLFIIAGLNGIIRCFMMMIRYIQIKQSHLLKIKE